jgi:Na+/melibiose symporter-like transporter
MDDTLDGPGCALIAPDSGPRKTRQRARGARRANVASALGTIWSTYGAPGSLFLTLFLKEGLHAQKWQIGLLMTVTFLGPIWEPAGAFLAERLGKRRPLFLVTFLLSRMGFFFLAAIPLLASRGMAPQRGIVLVLLVVAITRFFNHLGNPSWWSWMADLVHERRRGRFFGCRTQASSAVAAGCVLLGLTAVEFSGGMSNGRLLSSLFFLGAVFGVTDICLYFRIPEPPLARRKGTQGFGTFLASATEPIRNREFRRLLLGMGLWSFSVNLVLPFLPLYQRGETLAGHQLGLGVTWIFLACMNVLANIAGVLSSRRWARWTDRLGAERVLLLGSGYLFVNLAYVVIQPAWHVFALLPLAFVTGTLSAAWTVSNQQHLLRSAPRENRSFYISAHNFTNGLLMAAGPLIGGLLADRAPFMNWTWPGGLPCCYFHILLFLATIGGCGALLILLSGSADAESASEQVETPPNKILQGRFVLALPGNAPLPAADATLDEAQEVATL